MKSQEAVKKKIEKTKKTRHEMRQELMMFVIMLLVGFIVINHIQLVRRQNKANSLLSAYRAREEQLQLQEEQNRKLLLENEQLNNQKADLIDNLLIDHGYGGLSAELQKIRLLAGFTEVSGPGIILTLSDKEDYDILKDTEMSIVHDADIRYALDLLRSAGTAALSVNDLRITAVSNIQCIGSTIRCNNERMLPPFVIKAIGDPQALADIINQDNIFTARQSQEIGLIVQVQQTDELVILPFSGVDNLDQYITLLEGN